MLKHGRAGVPMEVMGLLLGEYIDEWTTQVVDVFAMPQSGHVGLVLPLCTSAATLGLSLYQFPVFLSFAQPNSPIAGKPLSQFWESMVWS